MSKYSSKPTRVNGPIEQVYNRFNDLTALKEKLAQLPAEQMRNVGDITIEPDSIAINNPQIGTLKFAVTDREAPNKIIFGAVGLPLPLELALDFKAVEPEVTEVVTSIDVEIPAMLKPMIGGKLQEAANKFGELMGHING